MEPFDTFSSFYGMVIHRDFEPLYVDDYYARVFGYRSAEEIMSLGSLLPLIDESDHIEAKRAYQAVMDGEEPPRSRIFKNRDKHGNELTVLTVDHITEWGGQPALQISIVDLSAQIDASKRLAASEQRYRALLESSLQGIVVHRDFTILFCNRAAAELLGYDDDATLMRISSLKDVFLHEQQPLTEQQYQQLMSKGEAINEQVLQLQLADGSQCWAQLSQSRVLWGDEAAVQILMLDYSEQYYRQQQLELRANYDNLTLLMNRWAMTTTLQKEFSLCRKMQRPLCALLLDVDNFKQINDTHGHNCGDEVLKQLAWCCKQGIRDSDHAARWGGEEFLVLLPFAPLARACEIAEQLCDTIRKLEVFNQHTRVPLTVSIGVACLSPQDHTALSLVDRADKALYQAKHSGKDQVQIADGDGE
ncbi:sensor domain-containing diguanylate cyclase [Aliagarivorans taiwanensis]|uniref:sensor domain-containing diguanylate cyclase n=1 Tax=Aliagarivorans taiwanensis TaxID=561966 RepID=UPI0003FECB85|nr:sensor domain-containing diguanylate cyclase [Aliagarivorans taiwanensis]